MAYIFARAQQVLVWLGERVPAPGKLALLGRLVISNETKDRNRRQEQQIYVAIPTGDEYG